MTSIRVYEDKAGLARAAAAHVVDCYRAAMAQHGDFTLVLSGGSTPRALFQLLADPANASEIDWANVMVFWGDERSVPPDHAESNYRMAKETLLDHVPLPENNIYRIPAEQPPAQAAQAYDETLRQFFASRAGAAYFDLILLGMGDDGHTASLFPHTAALKRDGTPGGCQSGAATGYLAHYTLTYPAINSAAHIAFLVSGAGKAPRLKTVLEGPVQQDELPSQGIQPINGDLVWLVDEDAAAQLEEKP